MRRLTAPMRRLTAPMRRPLAIAAGLAAALLAPAPAAALDDGLARTPPMGWNGWYAHGCGVTERTVRAAADALVRTGLRSAGYRYVSLDDCWMAPARGRDGRLRADRARFPSGIPALAARLHRRGLKLGVYLSAGPMTCARRPGSAGHLERDARTLAAWGADLVKLDWCFAPPEFNASVVYAQMRDALRATGRPVLLSISEWGEGDPWSWGPGTGHMWRTAHDTPRLAPRDRWRAVMRVVAHTAKLSGHAGPGAWNDPDILQVGLGGLTATEGRTVFSLWAMLAAPLIAGNDLTRMDPATRRTLGNRSVIAVDQDPAGRPGVRVSARRGHDVWVRELAGGDRVLLLVNRTARPVRFRADARRVFAVASGRWRVRDLWTHRARRTPGRFAARVAPHGAAMFRLRRLR
jgi:alpha-galactosidase